MNNEKFLIKNINYKEKRLHGTAVFPINVYCNMNYIEKYSLYVHWHDEIEFFYQAKGSSEFHINDACFTVGEGEVTIVPGEAIHFGNSLSGENFKFYSVVFNPHFLFSYKMSSNEEKYFNSIKNKKWDIPILLNNNSKIDQSLICNVKTLITRLMKKSTGYELGIKSILLEIFFKLMKNNIIKIDSEINRQNLEQINRIKKALLFIKRNYSKKITVNLLAHECCMSEYYFLHYFKKVVGVSPIEYISSYRVEKACDLIKNSDLNIIDIAIEVGFNNLSNFNRIFKKITKHTPSIYRKTNKNMIKNV